MKISITSIFLLMCFSLAAQQATIPSSFNKDIAGEWSGTMTYTDYQDDISQTTLKCKMKATSKKKSAVFAIGFEEPNGKIVYDKVKFKRLKRGSKVKFDGKKYQVESFKEDQKSGWTIRMSCKGKDNNRAALITQNIIYMPSSIMIAKTVTYEGTSKTIDRNKYFFKRI